MSVENEKEIEEQTPRPEPNKDAAVPSSDDTLLDVEHSAERARENEAEAIHVQEETTCFIQAESVNSSNSSRRASSEHVIPPPTSPFRRCLGR